MTDHDDAEAPATNDQLRTNRVVWLCGSAGVALLSAFMLPWPDAVASTALGMLMVVGADVDARNFLLPDIVTGGAVISGLAASAALDPSAHWLGLVAAVGRALLVAALLWIARIAYSWLRKREGIGLGDVKLAAAVGAWLPLEAVPNCFVLAAGAALIAVILARLRGAPIERTARVPFGAFLCLALWVVDFTTRLQSG